MIRFFLLLLCLAVTTSAEAHTRSYSYSLWELDKEPARVTVRINQYDLTRLDLHPDFTSNYQQQVTHLIVQHVTAQTAESACRFVRPSMSQSAEGWVALRATIDCDDPAQFRVTSSLLLDAISSHMHFVTVRDASGMVREKVLTEMEASWKVDGSGGEVAESPQTISQYWYLGVQHILSGWDHLAFIFGLLLLAATLSQLAWLITGFTLAHSLTLALAAMGQVHPLGSAIESLIGLSILLVALEYFWERGGQKITLPAIACIALLLVALIQPPGLSVIALVGISLFMGCYFAIIKRSDHPARWRLLIAFAFGLFHGFGFAGILAEMSLPDARLLPALFGFNLGVETGQLMVVVLIWPLLALLNRKMPVEQWGATAIAGLGTFWFITRAFI